MIPRTGSSGHSKNQGEITTLSYRHLFWNNSYLCSIPFDSYQTPPKVAAINRNVILGTSKGNSRVYGYDWSLGIRPISAKKYSKYSAKQ
jgi:hypothetical protein